MDRRFLVPAVALVVAAGGTYGATRGGESAAAATETVTVERGDVAVTVGGIGKVSTLTEAARQAAAAVVSDTASGGGASSASIDAVFATAPGHVTALHVSVGEKVKAGQPIATIADDGTTRTAIIQAEHDLAAARLDVAQLKLHDPATGLPPTAAETKSARAALTAARAHLSRLTGKPLPSDITAAQLEVRRAVAELKTEREAAGSRPDSIAAAELAVSTAQHRLALLTGAPDPAELAAARLEVAKAELEQETLLKPQAPATSAEIAAADAAVTSATEKVAAARVGAVAAEIAAAEAELARAKADRESLSAVGPAPSAAARNAAKLAVETAQAKLDQLLRPPAAAVEAARGELAKARADLAAVKVSGASSRASAAKAAISAAKARLDALRNPSPEAISTARADVARAGADLAILSQRGAPASKTVRAVAALRVNLATQQLRLAQELSSRLVVRAPSTGTVTSVLTNAGAAVDAATPLARVQDLDNLVVSVSLTEFDVSKTSVGSTARVRVDALGGRGYAGQVADVALSGNERGGVVTFPIIVELDDTEGLRPGMSISVRVVVAEREDVLRVPLDVLDGREGKDATVQVLTRSGKVKEREIKLGLISSTHAEVRSGLSAGDEVVVPAGEEEA